MNIHVKKNHPGKDKIEGKKVPFGKTIPIGDAAAFHIYAIEWFDDRIDFYYDDKKVFVYENLGEGELAWAFDKPFYVILNLAYGGAWGGAKGTDDSKLPQEFRIDYVRVFGK